MLRIEVPPEMYTCPKSDVIPSYIAFPDPPAAFGLRDLPTIELRTLRSGYSAGRRAFSAEDANALATRIRKWMRTTRDRGHSCRVYPRRIALLRGTLDQPPVAG